MSKALKNKVKLNTWVSVKDFGAIGDGNADDTAAIQAAINSISTVTAGSGPGGSVHVPAGRYKITSTLTLPFGVSIRGDGGRASIIEAYNCDGITFSVGLVDHNMQYVEDLGIEAKSGTNRIGIHAPDKPYPDNQNDGFFVHRCSIRGFNIGVGFFNAWQSEVKNCDMSNVNAGVVMDSHCVLVNVTGNTFVREAGGAGSYQNIGVFVGTPDVEALEVSSNFIYGFATAVKSADGWSLCIKSNTILTVGETQVGIDFTSVKEHLNIFDNVIESVSTSTSNVIGVIGRPTLTAVGGTTVIRDNRFFDDFGLGTSVGILINSATDTNQNNVHIYDNNFFRYTSADIRIYNPIKIIVERNKCESTAPTNSIEILAPVLCQGPVFVRENWCQKGLSLPSTFVANGNVVSNDNAISASWTPDDLWNQTYTPANASADAVTLTVNSASWSRVGKLYVVRLDVTWPVTAGTALARVTLPAAPVAVYSGSCGYTTYGSAIDYNTSAGASNFTFFDATGNSLTNANMSGKRVTATITFTVA